MNMDMDAKKLDDIITGREDTTIGTIKRFVDEDILYKDEEGIERVSHTIQVEKEFHYVFFKTDKGIEYHYDDEMAEFFNIPLDQYKKELRAHGGKYYDEMDCHIFTNKDNAQELLDDLAPYIVMSKLSGNNETPNIEKVMKVDITEDDNYWERYSEHYADGRDVFEEEEPII